MEYVKNVSSFDSVLITNILQISLEELEGVKWYDIVNYNHAPNWGVGWKSFKMGGKNFWPTHGYLKWTCPNAFIVNCPPVSSREMTQTHSVFTICKTGID